MSTTATIRYEPVEVDINSLETSVGRLLCLIKPRWASKKLLFKKLNTDDNFIRYAIFLKECEDEQYGIVVKIYPTNSYVYTNHQEQFRLITHFVHCDLAPRILLSFINGYFSVYIQEKTPDGKDQQTHELIARKISELHSTPPRFDSPQLADKLKRLIDLFTNKNIILHDRLDEIKKENDSSSNTNTSFFTSFKSTIGLSTVPKLPLTFDQLELQLKDIPWTDLSSDIDRIRSTFETNWSSLDIPVVVCLNNMKLNNFIIDPKNNSVSIIHFDYCSHNYFLIDIISYFLELTKNNYDTKYPERNIRKLFVSEYLKLSKLNLSSVVCNPRKPTDQELEYICDLCILLMAPVHLYWALWAFLQALLVEPTSAFDYFNYGKTRLAQYYRHKDNFFLPLHPSKKNIPRF